MVKYCVCVENILKYCIYNNKIILLLFLVAMTYMYLYRSSFNLNVKVWLGFVSFFYIKCAF